ncbi:MAG: hypothetical protein ACT4QF_23170 [Sporichthyaceae bacterium]|jgi:hypothetical protein
MGRSAVVLAVAFLCGGIAPASAHDGPADDYPLWFTRDGEQVPREVLRSSGGLQHCWPDSTLLFVGEGAATYARDPGLTFDERGVAAPYDPDATLPIGALDTGFRQDEVALWVSPTVAGVFAVSPNHTEFWPAVKPFYLACD